MQLPGDPPISIVSYFVLPPNVRAKDGEEFAKVLALFDRFIDIPLSDGSASDSTGAKGSSRSPPPPETLPPPAVSPSISTSSATSSLVGGKSVEIIENYGGAGSTTPEEGRLENGNSATTGQVVSQEESERKDTAAAPDSTAASTATASTTASNPNTTSNPQPSAKPATLSWAESMRFGLLHTHI